jgi:phenylacetate-CoA ligase
MDHYAAFFQSVLHPAWETYFRNRPTLSHLATLRQTQWQSLDELTAFQMCELSALLRHAQENVPYYRDAMGAAGVGAPDFRTPDDIRKLPLLSRDLARDSAQARTALASPFPTIRKTTSGSSGNPLVFGYDAGSEAWRQAIKLRGYEWAGYRPGDRVLHYWGPPPRPRPPLGKRLKIAVDRAIRREHYLDCVSQDDAHLLEAVKMIRSQHPKVIVCYAKSGGTLARFIVERGLRDWDRTIPVICGAEPLFPEDRALMNRAFGNAVFDTYGCRETMLIASECSRHEGLHVSMENILVEILVIGVDGSQRPANPGEVGNVVITDLHNLGQPLVRYVNGDLAVAGDNSLCGCGRSIPRIKSVDGRVTEALTDGRGGRVQGMYFCTIMVPLAHAVRRYKATQHKDRAITLQIVPTEEFGDDTARILRDNISRAIPGVPLKIELVDSIPSAASGKARSVVVEH